MPPGHFRMSYKTKDANGFHIAVLVVVLVAATAVLFIITPDYIIKKPSDPVLKPDGFKWRIACYEGGEYQEYTDTLKYLTLRLEEKGWVFGIDEGRLDSFSNSSEIWNYLGTGVKSDYLEFPPELFWSSGWNETERMKNSEEALQKLNSGQADLVLALGTIAGKDIATADHDIPVIIMASTDPVGAGLIDSVEDSGRDNVHTIVNPDQHRRQIEFFHDATGFKTIGIGYDGSSPESRSYSRIDLLREVSEERGFEIVEYKTIDDSPDLSASEESVVEAYTWLAPRVDAVYITHQNGVNAENAEIFLRPLIEYNVTTLSMDADLVSEGVLFSIVSGEPRFYASLYSESIGMILNGAKPRSLEMKRFLPFRIFINIETADKIGYDVPEGLLNSVDVFYCSTNSSAEVCQ